MTKGGGPPTLPQAPARRRNAHPPHAGGRQDRPDAALRARSFHTRRPRGAAPDKDWGPGVPPVGTASPDGGAPRLSAMALPSASGTTVAPANVSCTALPSAEAPYGPARAGHRGATVAARRSGGVSLPSVR